MNRFGKVLFPLLVLAAGALAARAIVAARPEPARQEPTAAIPLVRVTEAQRTSHQFRVEAQGTVRARSESVLTAEVSGKVTSIAPAFTAGGFFEQGDVLLRVEDADYRAAVAHAEANLASARLTLAREEEESLVAKREWDSLDDGSEPTALVLREPQLAQARATVAAAEASVAKARRDLQRTRIRAPYAGRVRQKSADVGSFVTPGVPIATVYAVDSAEIRLPLSNDELAFIEVPLSYRDDPSTSASTTVLLRASFAGRVHTWEGSLVRTEGEIDPRSRMITVVTRVDDPYGRSGPSDRPPLAVGMFVDAEIQGRRVDDVVVLPRAALRGEDQVLVVDDENRLQIRTVEVLRATRDTIVVGQGLAHGERICLSNLETVVDGMPVRVVSESEFSQRENVVHADQEPAR